MAVSEQEWRNEQERVNRVVQIINRQMVSLNEQAGEVKADIVDIRKHFWDDVTVNVDDPGEAAETYASIKQQAEVLSERERRHRHAQKRLKTLKRLQSSPYFGRIDFMEAGESKSQHIYLGLSSLLDEDRQNFLRLARSCVQPLLRLWTGPYLYLKAKIEGFQTVSSVCHVLIDEAQDYSPFQFRFIKELFPRASLTVLGAPILRRCPPYTDQNRRRPFV